MLLHSRAEYLPYHTYLSGVRTKSSETKKRYEKSSHSLPINANNKRPLLTTTTMDLSPTTMAHKAFEDAVANLSNGQFGGGQGNHGHGGGTGKEIGRSESAESREDTLLFNTNLTNNNAGAEYDEKAMCSRIEEIWRSGSGTVETKITQTMETILAEIDGLVGLGLGAFAALDSTKRALNQSKELAENRDREAKRLHSIDEQSRSTLSVSDTFESSHDIMIPASSIVCQIRSD